MLCEHIDSTCVIYINDILVYSGLNDHKNAVHQILIKLKKASLYIKAEKCEFSVRKVSFLGFIVEAHSILMNNDHICTVREWLTLISIKEVQGFLGFTNVYRRFIHVFSHIASGITKLTKSKDKSSFN